ncbi:uncharacterized protein A1O5_01096 [Cladophialophora psammophila CBS 110553]|uniref:Major facilitator superfamily (MFS) profile domain-containing protein n=1 Tax=Cladophialophora psammophila CBS 110553 TaxID=1182543 RepID=W9X8N2_9EURO|nr:uncharacterized protein A1O5_01096 [Cladophialophora psammophila CBS 110553]EXJ76588.1 hypothetical protein A1O5_01096 [Cladophialophora psammophila CBS 110553]
MSWGLYGYDNSFVSPLLSLPHFVARYQGSGTAFTAFNLNLLISVPLIGAALGSYASVPIQLRIGRKWSLVVAYSLFSIPGSILQLFAPNMAAFVIGRTWNNAGISILNTVSGLYLAELVPVHIRARAVGASVACANAVSVIATTAVWATEKIDSPQQYKIPLWIQVAFPVALALLTLTVLESPTWYMVHNQEEKARAVLMKLRHENSRIVESEMALLRTFVAQDEEHRQSAHFWKILDKENLQRTLIAGACLSTCQVGGQILILAYSTVLLVQSGVSNPFQITVIIFLAQFLGICIGPFLMDRYGRRPIGLAGFTILFLLDVAIGGLACGGLLTDRERVGLAALFIIFAFFNSLTFQSLVLLLPAELPAARYREATAAWSMFWSYVTATVTTFAVPQITQNAGLGAKTDLIFAGCMFLTIIGAYFYLPETRGRTLAEIDEMFRMKLPMRKWKAYTCTAVTERAVEEFTAGKPEG